MSWTFDYCYILIHIKLRTRGGSQFLMLENCPIIICTFYYIPVTIQWDFTRKDYSIVRWIIFSISRNKQSALLFICIEFKDHYIDSTKLPPFITKGTITNNQNYHHFHKTILQKRKKKHHMHGILQQIATSSPCKVTFDKVARKKIIPHKNCIYI